MKLSFLIPIANKYIPRERIISISKAKHIVFPYIKFPSRFRFSKKFPFIKPYYSFDSIRWLERYCIEVNLDNGEIIRQWYYDEGPGGYCSSVNCERGFDQFTGNYFR